MATRPARVRPYSEALCDKRRYKSFTDDPFAAAGHNQPVGSLFKEPWLPVLAAVTLSSSMYKVKKITEIEDYSELAEHE